MNSGLVNARRFDADGLWTIAFDGPQIGALRSQSGPVAAAAGWHDAGERLLTPALVDAHVHLDLAYTLDTAMTDPPDTLLKAIAYWTERKRTLSAEQVRIGALRAIADEVAHGVGYIRSHVDVGSAAELRLVDGVLEARQAAQDHVQVQLVAFPQDGLICDPLAPANLESALQLGVDLVGGIPHVEPTQRDGLAHLDEVFRLARDFNRDIDVHIDETDDPASVYTEHLAALTIRHGWQERVTASHVCALSSYDEVHASRVMDLLARAGVRVVTNPGVNLHLQGRYDRYPKRRGLTRVRDLLARGVLCAAGQDCIRDPFYPLGNGNLLDQAFLAAHAEHMSTPAGLRAAFDLVCAMAGRIVAPQRHGLRPGAEASVALFDAPDVQELVRLRPLPAAVFHRGAAISGAAAGRPVASSTRE